jgi:ribose 5-phosphate isomerase A
MSSLTFYTKILEYIKPDMIVGLGSSKLVLDLIPHLVAMKNKISAIIPSSLNLLQSLTGHGLPTTTFNEVSGIDLYIDSADEADGFLNMLKGQDGALTQEKILSYRAKKFIGIIEVDRLVSLLGKGSIALDILPMARSAVSREMVKLGGQPIYRENYRTDHGSVMVDVHNINILDARALERQFNDIPGILTNGIVALRPCDVLVIKTLTGYEVRNKIG